MKNVVFDVGGVLVRWRPREVAASVFADRRMQDLVYEQVFKHDDWRELDRGSLSREEILPRFAERTGFTTAEVSRLMDVAVESLALNEDTFALVTELREKGVPLYMLSNMPQISYDSFRKRYTFFDSFDGLVISFKIGMIKPEPEIYRYLLDTFSLDPVETVFVDDCPENLEAGEKFGITGLLFVDAADCRARLRTMGFPV